MSRFDYDNSSYREERDELMARIAELEAQKTRSQEHYIKLLKAAEAENVRLREVSGRLLKGIEAYQYGAKPPIPLPEIAPAANELEALLGGGDE